MEKLYYLHLGIRGPAAVIFSTVLSICQQLAGGEDINRSRKKNRKKTVFNNPLSCGSGVCWIRIILPDPDSTICLSSKNVFNFVKLKKLNFYLF